METYRLKVINSIVQDIENIKYIETRKVCELFFADRSSILADETLVSEKRYYKRLFKKIQHISIDMVTIEDVISMYDDSRKNQSLVNFFYSYLYINKLCNLFNEDYLKFRFLISKIDYEYLEKIKEDKTVLDRTVYCKLNHKKSDVLYKVILDNSDDRICKLLNDFYHEDLNQIYCLEFINIISAFMLNNNFISINTSIDDNFIEKFYSENVKLNQRLFTESKRFFIWVIKQLTFEEKKIKCPLYNIIVLSHGSFSYNFKEGYRPVKYNEFDKIPLFDNWMLIPNLEEIETSTRLTQSSVIPIRFQNIKNRKLRYLAKHYMWHNKRNIRTLSREIEMIEIFVNLYFPNEDENYQKIDGMICANFKTYVLKSHSNNETRSNLIETVRSFIKHLKKNKLIDIDSMCFLLLQIKNCSKIKGGSIVQKVDLERLAAYFTTHKYDNRNSMIYYTVFHLALNTEFRISQITQLDVDCVKESMKKNEYIIRSITKVSSGAKVEQPCARVVKLIIDDYLYEISNFRESIIDAELKKYLFVRINKFQNYYRVLTGNDFTKHLHDVCKQLGIERINSTNLRSIYITNAKELIQKNDYSDATLLAITGHSNINTVNNHYTNENIKDALQATQNIIIGNVDVKGKIVNKAEEILSSKQHSVEDECGYCQSVFCDLNGPLSCLLCPNFATTIDRIPFFIQHIKNFDESIQKSENQHDIEDYVNLKRLFAKYLEQLLKLKEININE